MTIRATRKESGSAPPACGPAAGAFRTTARTGPIKATESAMQFGRLRTFFWSLAPVALAVASDIIYSPQKARTVEIDPSIFDQESLSTPPSFLEERLDRLESEREIQALVYRY